MSAGVLALSKLLPNTLLPATIHSFALVIVLSVKVTQTYVIVKNVLSNCAKHLLGCVIPVGIART